MGNKGPLTSYFNILAYKFNVGCKTWDVVTVEDHYDHGGAAEEHLSELIMLRSVHTQRLMLIWSNYTAMQANMRQAAEAGWEYFLL